MIFQPLSQTMEPVYYFLPNCKGVTTRIDVRYTDDGDAMDYGEYDIQIYDNENFQASEVRKQTK